MDKSNLVLIGMPGCGKSTIGVLLAKTLNKPFIDTDLIIQHQEKRYLQDIINKDGIESFLKKEENAVLGMNVQDSVIATGGSVVYSGLSINHLKKNGYLVYLKLRYEDIEKRIKNIKSRGIVKSKIQTLYDLYMERVPLYERYADITVYCTKKNDEKVIMEITEEFYKKQNKF